MTETRFSSPHGDFSFSICPLFSLVDNRTLFSSPHGDFSFSMGKKKKQKKKPISFRPLTGISLFLFLIMSTSRNTQPVFSSPHGDFSFSIRRQQPYEIHGKQFSSPHGDFSFSIRHNCCLCPFSSVFVPSRGFLFFYPISYSPYKSRAIFIICGANIFKPSECYF